MALIFFGAVLISALASAPPRRTVEMEITLPNGAAPRVIVPEDEGAIADRRSEARLSLIPGPIM
jgi:hypothetical protein